MLNCLGLALVRRPTVAALISLEILLALTLLSRFKFDKLWMTVDFVDVMIIDRDTTAFLLAIFPSLRWWIAVWRQQQPSSLIAIAWRLDSHRIRPRDGVAGFAASAAALVTVSLLWPTGLTEDFEDRSYVSKFARTGVEAVHELMTRGYLDVAEGAGRAAGARGRHAPAVRPASCHTSSCCTMNRVSISPRHPRSRCRPAITGIFESFDGRSRKLLVEGVGGPSWFTEFNVLTGLSVRSFGRFATSVTRIAAGHVYRGLPRTLSDCGYQTFSLYPFYGSFIGSREFQTTAGIAHYLDMHDLGTTDFEPDSFYYDRAIDLIARERNSGPLFLYVYTVANHFPWDEPLRPELTPDWRDLGNPPDVEEYIRRQSMSAQDYRQLLERLSQEFPTDAFLIVRYGDHQPQFAPRLILPSLEESAPAKRAESADPRYLTTYYAIDAVNFTPVDVTSALDSLDASYLPLVALQAAGVPLDASFSAQWAILQRCGGYFYSCQQGAEARRFNRLLIEGGLIKWP